MTRFDYNIVAELVPTKIDSELLSRKSRRHRRYPVGYGRFARAEVGKKIFDRDGIRRFHDSEDYPLVRHADAR